MAISMGKASAQAPLVVASAGAALASGYLLKKVWEMVQMYRTVRIVTCCGRNADHCLCGYTGPCQAHEHGKVIVFVAKEIVTMDPTWPSAKVVAVQDGRILGVGDQIADLDAWTKRPGVTCEVDETYKDCVIMPGFIEQHNHPLIGGTALSLPCISYKSMPTPFGQTLPGVKSREEAIERMSSIASKLPAGEELVVWGWDCVAMGGHLQAADLDLVDNTRIVLVWDCSLHFAYSNSHTIKHLKLTPSKHGKMNGVGTNPDGSLNGQFLGVEAMGIVMPIFSKLMQPARALDSLHYIVELGRENGITTMCELMHGGINILLESALYRHFFNHPSTPMRCVVVCDGQKAVTSCLGSVRWAVSWLRNLQRGSTEKLIFNNGVKFFTDDAFLGLTMCLGFPGYSDGRKGIWNCGERGAMYAAKMAPWWKAGCRIHVHSNGDAAQDATAEALSMLQRLWPRFDHRFCLEHYGVSAWHLHRKLSNLGASVAVNSFYIYHRAQLNTPHMGKDRAHAAGRLKSALDAGLPVALHTDTPVAPPKPLQEISTAVNRLSDDGEVLCPAERVTVMQALRMKTVDAAYVHGLDALLGSVEAGKLADFTVLDRNPLSVPTTELPNLKVVATVVGGNKYDATVARQAQFPKPPAGLLGPLFWMLSSSSSSAAAAERPTMLARFYRLLARLKGCTGWAETA
mmetsp:Transcript_70557/g.147774  ORF Transcript_70557/g.147774 Transcript_70557/m.147774 type:complete len:685 (-) Transcript_70557:298-2352(-)